MDQFVSLLNIILPATIVLFAMYMTMKSFLSRELNKKQVDVKIKTMEAVLPIRLQAYERIVLYLERISPHNMVLRVNDPGFTVADLRLRLLNDIREELNHNLSQQVYMSEELWAQVKTTTEEILAIVNQTASNLNPDGKSVELAKAIFDKMSTLKQDPVEATLSMAKQEIQKIF